MRGGPRSRHEVRNSCERRRSADRSANKVFLSEARKAFATRHRARERGESNREWRVCGPPADACRAWSACGENAQSRKRNVGLFRASGWPQCFRQCSSGWETGERMWQWGGAARPSRRESLVLQSHSAHPRRCSRVPSASPLAALSAHSRRTASHGPPRHLIIVLSLCSCPRLASALCS